MRLLLPLIATALVLTGCVSPEGQRRRDLIAESQQCQNLGFAAGSPELAQCMDTAAASRSADADRAAAQERDWQRREDQNWKDFNRTQGSQPAATPAPAQPMNCTTNQTTTTAGNTTVTRSNQACSSF
ncbi:hypothetical protein DWF00_15340 [Bosea caraganae]|uniref:Uncharacterized protein n=1 Tax=Bosea caraganae TaxID=2763117 RepID=A0A370L770_9HYPH|nr:hypothetical protein [Bosea caraganae]RDJ25452.1 hypothetical protein DWE98_12045 [Bosea caraganae]RDJ25763.1 hypothetical protein DWF00_15340 [Bosea caraganae]